MARNKVIDLTTVLSFAVDPLKYLAYFCWSVYGVFVVIGLLGYRYKAKSGNTKCNYTEFIIVTVANKSVRNSLIECIEQTSSRFPDLPLSILVDQGSKLLTELLLPLTSNSIGISGLLPTMFMSSIIAPRPVGKRIVPIRVVVVPNPYRQDLVGKGRAMNYFIESRVEKDKWYSFIDDDNIILDSSMLYEIPYYEKMGYVACNPLIVPREGKSKIAYIMDFIRRFDDVTIFRFFTGICKIPMLGLHGEVLTVKGSILKEIGYHHRTLTEDFRFAVESIKQGKMKTWQSATKVSIKSANNVHDLLKQRGRWFKGIAMDLAFCTPAMKLIVGLRMSIWMLGIIGSWALSPLWVLYWHGAAFYFIIGGVCPWVVLSAQIISNKQPLYYILCIPLFGILESMSPWFGLKQKKFVGIDKN
jgi:egghead protein (zeste-white 4 protein)